MEFDPTINYKPHTDEKAYNTVPAPGFHCLLQ